MAICAWGSCSIASRWGLCLQKLTQLRCWEHAGLSALLLFMFRVALAYDKESSLPADDHTFRASGFDGCLDFHVAVPKLPDVEITIPTGQCPASAVAQNADNLGSGLLHSQYNPPLRSVIRAHLHFHAVAQKHFDVIDTHFTGEMSQNSPPVSVGNFNPKQRIGEILNHYPLLICLWCFWRHVNDRMIVAESHYMCQCRRKYLKKESLGLN